MKINVNPMTMNQAYTGRRFKSDKYKQYIRDVGWQLKPLTIPEGELELHIIIGVSNNGFDLDNCAKPFIDILQKRYDFNDNRIYALNMMKRVVPKGQEFISFDLFECLKGEENG